MIRSTSLAAPHQVGFTNGEWTATADVPREKGGDGRGFGPHELLEAALATCLTITVRKYAAEHGYPLAGVTAEVRIDRTRPPEVALVYALTFDGPLSAEQRDRLAEAAAVCPVARTLTGRLTCRPTQE